MISTGFTFTSNFVDHLAESRRRLDDYVETNKEKTDSLTAAVKEVQSDEQQNIDSLLRQLKSFHHQRGVAESSHDGDRNAVGGVAERRRKLERKQAKLEQELSMLRSKNIVEQAQLDEVLVEEAAVRKKADEVRIKKEEIEMAKGITVEDLTKGLLNYRFTGLTFVKGEKGALKFKFTKLDPVDVSRPFTFTLSMGENNDYELSDLNPHLDKDKTDLVLCGLNAGGNSGFNSFVVGMRKLFKITIP